MILRERVIVFLHLWFVSPVFIIIEVVVALIVPKISDFSEGLTIALLFLVFSIHIICLLLRHLIIVTPSVNGNKSRKFKDNNIQIGDLIEVYNKSTKKNELVAVTDIQKNLLRVTNMDDMLQFAESEISNKSHKFVKKIR